jgi:mannose-1-phosphate guanylyltransferase/mannose-6-phosphate isomerase
VWDILDHNAEGNSASGEVVIQESRNCLVQSEEPMLTAVIGLDDVVVISTPDAVLVSARSKAEQLKIVVNELKLRNYRAAVEHRRVHRPWGFFQEVDCASRYKVKRIVVKPGCMLSLQKHFHRSEHWVVVRGTAEVTVDDTVRNVHENESIYIPIGSHHRLSNPGKIDLELIEVQVGSYLGEDDIVRFDDVYGRERSAQEIGPLS